MTVTQYQKYYDAFRTIIFLKMRKNKVQYTAVAVMLWNKIKFNHTFTSYQYYYYYYDIFDTGGESWKKLTKSKKVYKAAFVIKKTWTETACFRHVYKNANTNIQSLI